MSPIAGSTRAMFQSGRQGGLKNLFAAPGLFQFPRMSMREIPMSQWPSFLEGLGRMHRAWLGTVDRGGRVEVREQPLESIAANGGIDIRIGHKAIHVSEPQAVRVEETPGGVTQALQIDDATGRRVTLRFRIAPPPSVLDGVAPAER